MRLTTQPVNGVDLLTQYCASGAPEVFAQIMRAYGGMVFSVCLKVTGDAADAEDASQATFLTLAVQCKTGAKITYLGPWLKKVAKRSSLDLVRSRKRRTRRENVTAEGRPEHYAVHPGARSADGEISKIIHSELDELPAKYRMPLVLHYFGGLSHTEISSEMRCTPAALGVRLHRGRKMLGKRLKARGISMEGAALGVALATSVNHALGEHFIHSTTSAVASIAWSRPGLAASALGAALPSSLGIVPQLVQEVARSMAHARLKFATFALALSITMLGGAAEAVRHLPESLRPNLDFLSPSRAIENLFRSVTPSPRVQSENKPEPIAVAPVARKVSPDAVVYIPRIDIPLPPNVIPQPIRYSPILALQIPTITPPLSKRVGEEIKARQARAAEAKVTPLHHPPAAPSAEHAENKSEPDPLRIAQSGGSSDEADSNATDRSPQNIQPSAPPHNSNRNREQTTLTTFIPAPSKFEKASANLNQYTSLTQSTASLMQGTKLGAGVNPTNPFCDLGDCPIASEEVLQAVVSGSVLLRSNDLFVRPGDGEYSWSDATVGIQENGVNSVQLTLNNVTNPGVVSIERLSRKTMLAPARPEGHTFIGIWSLRTDVNYDSIRLTAHYDDALAQSLGLREDVLKLWAYTGDAWTRINDASFVRDMENHTLTGEALNVQFVGVSAPEPSVLGLLALMTGGLLRRRRS